MTKSEGTSDSMGFATVKDTFPGAAAQLVVMMRATLRHAQEITASVGEAEGANERAQTVVTNVENTTTVAEQSIADAEIEKVVNWLNRPQETFQEQRGRAAAAAGADKWASSVSVSATSVQTGIASVPVSVQTSPPRPSNAAGAISSTVSLASEDATPGGAEAGGAVQGAGVLSTAAQLGAKGAATPYGSLLDNANMSGMPTLYGQSAAASSTKTLTSEMTEEIETTVMWVQQLLESVHFVESEDVLEPGASLLSIVQPGRRGQKEIALHQSVNLFHEKKEEEEDADDEAPKFRNRALQAVKAQREGLDYDE